MAQANGSAPTRLGLVGCGWISDWHGRAAAQLPEVEIVACCDTVPEAATAWRERHGCERAYTGLERMLAEHELDGVVLATWPPHHFEQILACLDAGIRNILCEKALTVTTEDAIAAYTAARGAGALVVEGYMYRHHPATAKVRELIAAGALGTLDRVSAAFDVLDPEEPGPDEPRGWRQRKELFGGVPFDLACYCVDACNHLAGAPPVRVAAIARRSERYDTVARLYALVEYENGVVGTISSSNQSDFDYELKVNGSHGNVVLPLAWTPNAIPPRERVDDGESTEVLLRRSAGVFAYRTEPVTVPGADPYLEQLRAFAAAVRTAAAPTPSLAESVLNIATINALLTSAEEHASVEVVLPDDVRRELVSHV